MGGVLVLLAADLVVLIVLLCAGWTTSLYSAPGLALCMEPSFEDFKVNSSDRKIALLSRRSYLSEHTQWFSTQD